MMKSFGAWAVAGALFAAGSAWADETRLLQMTCDQMATLPDSRAACMKAGNEGVSQRKLIACGQNTKTPINFKRCLAAAAVPEVSEARIIGCGMLVKTQESYAWCLEASKSPKLTDQMLDTCAAKSVRGSTYQKCLADLGVSKPVDPAPARRIACESVSESEVTCEGRRYVRDSRSVLDSAHPVRKVLNAIPASADAQGQPPADAAKPR